MKAFQVIRNGKYHVLAPSWITSNDISTFFVDSNFILGTCDVTRPIGEDSPTSKQLEELRETWKFIGSRKTYSDFAVIELSWAIKKSQMYNKLEIGEPKFERYKRRENQFQKISSLDQAVRNRIFVDDLSPQDRVQLIAENHKFEDDITDASIRDSSRIIYQTWEMVLLLMKFLTRISTNDTVEQRVQLMYEYFQDLVDFGIPRSGETEFLAQFVFFGGTIQKIGTGHKVSVAEIFKTEEWGPKGVLKVAKNVAFDLVFLQWTRMLMAGELFQSPHNTALVTGDRPLVAFANQLERHNDHTGQYYTYRIPPDSMAQEIMDAAGNSALVRPAPRKASALNPLENSETDIARHRRLLVKLARNI